MNWYERPINVYTIHRCGSIRLIENQWIDSGRPINMCETHQCGMSIKLTPEGAGAGAAGGGFAEDKCGILLSRIWKREIKCYDISLSRI